MVWPHLRRRGELSYTFWGTSNRCSGVAASGWHAVRSSHARVVPSVPSRHRRDSGLFPRAGPLETPPGARPERSATREPLSPSRTSRPTRREAREDMRGPLLWAPGRRDENGDDNEVSKLDLRSDFSGSKVGVCFATCSGKARPLSNSPLCQTGVALRRTLVCPERQVPPPPPLRLQVRTLAKASRLPACTAHRQP